MKYEITCNTSYGKKGARPFEVRENLDAMQQHDDQLYEIRKSVRLFVNDLLSRLDDAPFRVTVYCIAEENYISNEVHREDELKLNVPKGASLLDFEDALLKILEEVDLKYEVFLSSRQVNSHLIVQILGTL